MTVTGIVERVTICMSYIGQSNPCRGAAQCEFIGFPHALSYSAPTQLRSISPGTLAVRETSCRSFATDEILNQMAYNAGKNTSVRTVPPKVPPIKV